VQRDSNVKSSLSFFILNSSLMVSFSHTSGACSKGLNGGGNLEAMKKTAF
jgi:hypothetical protein